MVGKTTFFTSRVRVERVPAWLLVNRPQVTPDQGRALLNMAPMGQRCFLLDAFSCSMAPPAGAAAWLGDGGEEEGASDGMVARVSVLRRGRAVAQK